MNKHSRIFAADTVAWLAAAPPPRSRHLAGDPSKARLKLCWMPRITTLELVREMVESHDAARRDSLVKLAGFRAYDYDE
jgi:GDPmannose 4,6-dehydratase